MNVIKTAIEGVVILEPRVFNDARPRLRGALRHRRVPSVSYYSDAEILVSYYSDAEI